MRLTRRGRWVVAAAGVILLWVWLLGTYTIGQQWKDNRVPPGNIQEGTTP